MSASSSDKEKHTFYYNLYIDPFDKAILSTMFDHNTDIDIIEIEMELQQIKALKRLCLFKTLSFPLELIVLIFNWSLLKKRCKYQWLYLKFLRNKISYQDFKKALLY